MPRPSCSTNIEGAWPGDSRLSARCPTSASGAKSPITVPTSRNFSEICVTTCSVQRCHAAARIAICRTIRSMQYSYAVMQSAAPVCSTICSEAGVVSAADVIAMSPTTCSMQSCMPLPSIMLQEAGPMVSIEGFLLCRQPLLEHNECTHDD